MEAERVSRLTALVRSTSSEKKKGNPISSPGSVMQLANIICHLFGLPSALDRFDLLPLFVTDPETTRDLGWGKVERQLAEAKYK